MDKAFSPTDDTRSAPRYALNLPVGFDGGTGVTHDLSSGGVFFTCDKNVTVGSRISLTITLQGAQGDVPITLYCRGPVLRVDDSGDQMGIAVQFEDCQIKS